MSVSDRIGVVEPGELRIYLGAAPGVGKTYAMLAEAHRRAERGADVVVAAVQTHGRARTAQLLAGLEGVGDHGTPGPELDIAAVLARNPQVALVDDLAHANPPGSRNRKRWQDVAELLDAGITVISTVNVAELESLADVVTNITGIQERETVPDSVVRRAGQVELIDITPEALRRRISHGNVYAPGQTDAALSNYFRSGNLAALRQLTLLWLADQVDIALTRHRQDEKITDVWETRERVLVAITGGPGSETLIRRAARIASKSSAELMVLHVLRDGKPSVLSSARGAEIRELTIRLGGSVHTVVGEYVPDVLLDFARDINATQLVIGSSRRSRWALIFDESVAAAVVQRAGRIDVHIVPGEQSQRRFRPARISPPELRAVSWVAAILVPFVVCAITVHWLDRFLDTDGDSALFFVGVLVVAALGRMLPAALSALLSGALLNYYFIDPVHDFTIDKPDSAVTGIVLLLVGVAVAGLVGGATKRAREAARASHEAELLTLFAGSVLRDSDLATLLERVRETYTQRSVRILRERGSGPEIVAAVGKEPSETESAIQKDGHAEPVRPAIGAADTVIDVGDDEFAMVLSGRDLTARDRRVLSAVAKQAVGLVRQRELAEDAGRAESVMRADELRRSLLSAVSHDLRTPLAAAKAAVSSLRSDDVDFSPEDTAELLATVEESIDQLTALVGNLLDSSRLAAGVVKPALAPAYLEEVVQRALVGLDRRVTPQARFAIDRVKVEVGPTVVMADAGLLERVLANLIDNALRYAPDGVIRVNAGSIGDRVLINVIDEGCGLPRGDEDRLFSPFQRLGDRDNTSGVGLGLSVARGFIEAMGGMISATETPGGGLTMMVDLAAPTGAS